MADFSGIKVSTIIESNSEIQKKLDTVLKNVSGKISIGLDESSIEKMKVLLKDLKGDKSTVPLADFKGALKEIEQLKASMKDLFKNPNGQGGLVQLNDGNLVQSQRVLQLLNTEATKLNGELDKVSVVRDSKGIPIKQTENMTNALGEQIKVVKQLGNDEHIVSETTTTDYKKQREALESLKTLQLNMNNKINNSGLKGDNLTSLQSKIDGLSVDSTKSAIAQVENSITKAISQEKLLVAEIKQEELAREKIASIQFKMNSKVDTFKDNSILPQENIKALQSQINGLSVNSTKKELAEVSDSISKATKEESRLITEIDKAEKSIRNSANAQKKANDDALVGIKRHQEALEVMQTKMNGKVNTLAKNEILPVKDIEKLRQEISGLAYDSTKLDMAKINESIRQSIILERELAREKKSANQANVQAGKNQQEILYSKAEESLQRQFADKTKLIKADELQTAELNKQLALEKEKLKTILSQLEPAQKQKLGGYANTLQSNLNLSSADGLDKMNAKIMEVESKIVKLKAESQNLIPTEQSVRQIETLESAILKLKNDINTIGTSQGKISIGEGLKTQFAEINNQFRVLQSTTNGNSIFDKMTTDAKNFTASMNTSLANLQNKYGSHIPTAGLDELKAKLQQLNNIPVGERTEQDLAKMNQAMKELRQSYAQLDSETRANAGGFFGTLSHNIQSFMGFYVGAGGIISVINGIKSGVASIVEMDTALTNLNKVVDMSREHMEEMKNSAIEMGKALGQSGTSIMAGMAEWGRVTKSLNEIKDLTRVDVVAPLYSNM